MRLQVGRQHHGDAGAPGAEQGDGQLGGIVEMHGDAPHAACLQAAGQGQALPAQRVAAEFRRAPGGAVGACRGIQQQALKIAPGQAGSRSLRWRSSHSPANSRPISM
ncbi:hypothetical protein D3C78_1626240 [compost metagenome]